MVGYPQAHTAKPCLQTSRAQLFPPCSTSLAPAPPPAPLQVRVMPRCWYVLLRFWLRVDRVMVRLREVSWEGCGVGVGGGWVGGGWAGRWVGAGARDAWRNLNHPGTAALLALHRAPLERYA